MSWFRRGLLLQVVLLIGWSVLLLQTRVLLSQPNPVNTDRAVLENYHPPSQLLNDVTINHSTRGGEIPNQEISLNLRETADHPREFRGNVDDVSGAPQCRHPAEGSLDVANFYGVGGDHVEFRRKFSTVSKTNLRLWLHFYFCDAPKPRGGDDGGATGVGSGVAEMVVGLRVFVLKGIRLEFNDVFGRLFYSMTIFKSLKYVVNHHHDEKTLRQDKVQWDHMTDHVSEFLSYVEVRFSQDLTGVQDGDERQTHVRVSIAGKEMPEYTFRSFHSLEVVQTLSLDCVSYSFDCAEVTEVKFGGLSPRTRAEDVAFQLRFLQPYSEMIAQTAALVLERTKEATVHIPAAARGDAGKLRVLVGIMSTPGRFEFRLAQRRTWLTHPLVRSGVLVFKFFLSRGASELMNQVMEEEARVFGDVVLSDEGEVYLTIGYKVAQIFNYFTTSEWDHDGPTVIGKSDDDTFKNIGALYSNLVAQHTPNAVYGHPFGVSQAPTVWYWFTGDTREYSSGVPMHMAGPFYVVNSQLVRSWLALEERSAWLMSHQMEDRQTGLWIEHYQRTTGTRITFVTLEGLEEECSEGVTVLHHVVPEDMDCLYTRFVETGRFTCCGKKGSNWH